jgi:NitT/TauT family transport system ATP-binding protein
MPGTPAFAMHRVCKAYRSRSGSVVQALDHVAFAAASGEVTCLLGPTGSGKSTILRLLAGLDAPDLGTLAVGGAAPSALHAGSIGYLTQRHTLMPWKTVSENIALPMEIKGEPDAARVRAICASLGLEASMGLYPYEISGGMLQRAAIGRLLASEARFWLMDEPFSSLDEKTQHSLQRLLLSLVGEHALSVLFVTHQVDEAVQLAARIVVLSTSPGRVVEEFRPELAHPRDRLGAEYGEALEVIRRSMESVIGG